MAEKKVLFLKNLTKEVVIGATPTLNPKAESKLSKKAQAVQEYIANNNFQCKSEVVAGLVSLLLGEKIVLPKEDASPPFFSAIVIFASGCIGPDRYKGQVLVVLCGSEACAIDGNHVAIGCSNGTCGDQWRYASRAEIEIAFNPASSSEQLKLKK